MDFMYINDEQLTEDELLTVLKHNSETIRLRKSEIERLKKAANASIIEVKEVPTIVKKEEVIKRESDKTDFDEEVEFYISEIESLKEEELSEKLSEVLPVRANYNYKKIIIRIIAEYVKDIKDINEILIMDTDKMDITELNEYKEEIKKLSKKIELLKIALKDDKKIETENNHQNRIIFAPTAGGNIRAIDSIKDMPIEYYESFLELFNSIKDGTFKNIRKFSNSGQLNGLFEVKGFKVRVYFDRIFKDTYAIIGVYVKKVDNDKAFRSYVTNIYDEYKKNMKKIKENIANEEFLKLHEDYEKELFALLNSKKDEKGAKK